jgi:hypothetical protein
MPQPASTAAELIILTNQGATPGVRELAAAFARVSGHTITVVQEDGAALEGRIANGPADLITGNPGAFEELVRNRRVVAGTVTPFVVAGLGLSGAPARRNPTSAPLKPTRRRCSRQSRSAIRAGAAARTSPRASPNSVSPNS